MRWNSLLTGSLTAVWCAAAGAAAVSGAKAPAGKPAAASPQAIEYFERHVRPVLAKSCYSCHGAKVQQAGLRLDTGDWLRPKAGAHALVIPGKPDESPLIQAVRYHGRVKMPPQGRLPQAEIDALAGWVRQGAPWPAPPKGHSAFRIPHSALTHWAFKPVRRPAIPAVKNRAWVRTPVDAFILAKLEAKGLSPAPRADRRTLIRRVYADVIGLPPTPAEVEAFASDRSPDAWEKVVDRLLASPHYGERWGRYWLDVARYSDTKGYVFFEEGRFPWAWTYRDYVIRSLNEDKPYDRFILEQLAADRLPLGEDRRPLAALGFLTLGGRFMNNPHDIIDDRIDVVTRGLLGLTVTCARCHDHKFDPIPAADYYSLYGVFASTFEPVVPPLLEPAPRTEAYEAFAKELAKREKALADFVTSKHEELVRGARLRAGEYMLAAYTSRDQPLTDDFMFIADATDLNPKMLLRWRFFLDSTRRTPHPVLGLWHALSDLPEKEFAARAPAVIRAAANVNPLVARAFAAAPPKSMADVAALYGELFKQAAAAWQEALKTGQPQALPDAAQEQIRQVLYGPDTPPMLVMNPIGDLSLLPDRPSQAKLQELLKAVETWRATGPDAPPRPQVLFDLPQPLEPRIFNRGSPGNLGDAVPRRFLRVLSHGERQPFRDGSGRLDLARAIADPNNPLTARVMVNRVWLGHFGSGLVRTPSDFGVRSDPPTHPELLDYLAAAFVAPSSNAAPRTRRSPPELGGWGATGLGWSLKSLHRLILLSNTYRQASSMPHSAFRIPHSKDPENTLLWRANRRRLDWEALRDSMLSAAGALDGKIGGESVDLVANPSAPRRTVYAHVDRLNVPGLFRTFDFPSPDSTSPQRDQTTVPQQSLFLMNGPFVVEQARRLAARPELSASWVPPVVRIQRLYRLLYGRPATPREVRTGLRFTGAATPASRDPSPWQYGWGEVDAGGQKLKAFHPLPHFTGDAWQGGPALPDPKLGWVRLTADGGHAGNDPQHAAVRRWVAPRDAVVSIEGAVRHPRAEGDGVQARIFSSRAGLLAASPVHNATVQATVPRLEVRAGDTLDFVIDCRASITHDEFTWAPVIREAPTTAWDAASGFRGPGLTAWEQYAQALLLSNELAFVD